MKSRTRINQSAAVLWASAFVLGGMVIMQAGRMQGSTAEAAVATNRNDYSLVTTNSGKGGDADPNELLYIINTREEVMMVYEIEDARKGQITLRDGGKLENLFQRAR